MTKTERRAARAEARATLVAILIEQAADPERVHVLAAADRGRVGTLARTTYIPPGAQITDVEPTPRVV
jgi:hypothetical protein